MCISVGICDHENDVILHITRQTNTESLGVLVYPLNQLVILWYHQSLIIFDNSGVYGHQMLTNIAIDVLGRGIIP